jgi:hypothetical protein
MTPMTPTTPTTPTMPTMTVTMVPTAIPPDSAVKYTLNPQGELSAVWILTAAEAGPAK